MLHAGMAVPPPVLPVATALNLQANLRRKVRRVVTLMRNSTSTDARKQKRLGQTVMGQACCLKPCGWGAAVSGSTEVRPSASLERNRGGAHTQKHLHTCTHTHTGKRVAFDRAAVRTGQLCSSDSTGHCLITTRTYSCTCQSNIKTQVANRFFWFF